ncbi:hypothetical protein BDR04DRAFT_1088530 [Suillus decipiens]|nr:hypothetical protein BDR04DRAFT_1088530 [Suillus decipiens]
MPSGPCPFLEPLGFGLPCLETITQEKLFATDMTMEANWATLLSLELTRAIVILIEVDRASSNMKLNRAQC